MNTNTLLLLLGGAGVLYFVTRPSAPPLITPPMFRPGDGAAAGYTPQPNGPTDPGDRNSWVPGLVTGLAGTLTSVLGGALRGSGSSTSSGTQSGDSTYNGGGDPYGTSFGDQSENYGSMDPGVAAENGY